MHNPKFHPNAQLYLNKSTFPYGGIWSEKSHLYFFVLRLCCGVTLAPNYRSATSPLMVGRALALESISVSQPVLPYGLA
jgi:hypothetical protein